jgi:hypothetical protein
MPSLILGTIQQCIRDGNYLVKSQAVIHALKEGFDRANMVEAVLNGSIIEDYADAKKSISMWQDDDNDSHRNLLARRV